MKHVKFIYVGILTAALAFSGCSSDFLETAPTNAVSETSVTTAKDLYNALNGIHRKMVASDRGNQGMGGEPGFIICREAQGDDMTWDTQGWHQTYLNWTANTNPSTSYNYNLWLTYYEFILNCNKILELYETLSDDEKALPLASHVLGETRAFRAWAHFQLVQYYAFRYDATSDNSHPGVPIHTASEAVDLARNTVAEVYKFINDELTAAATLLKGYKANDINHYSEKVIYGFLARVALTQQNYKAAGDYAAKAIEIAEAEGHRMMTYDQANVEKNPTLFPDISSLTKDAIYAALTQDHQSIGFYSFYAYMSWNFASSSIRTGIKCISQSTYDLMSDTDIRRAWWDPTGKAEVPSSSYYQRVYQNRKFTARSTSTNVGDFAFMRLTEMYLLASEAYARAGETETAKSYFTKFIAERDPSYTDSGKTGEDFAEEVMNHRRIELWGEGFRWFDLKRLNRSVERTGSNFDVSFAGFLTRTPSEKGWAYEIPDMETNYNPNMVKNY